MTSYHRVMPRDLFNEGKLLTCVGKLWIELEKINMQHLLTPQESHEHFAYGIDQDRSDGSIYMIGVYLNVNTAADGVTRYTLSKPLNSVQPFPLYCERVMGIGELTCVFHDDGTLTDEFLELISHG